MLKAEVAVDVQEDFQQVFLIIFFVERHVFSSILAWQVKHGKKPSNERYIIKKNAFDQFSQVQFIASNTGPSVVYPIWWSVVVYVHAIY